MAIESEQLDEFVTTPDGYTVPNPNKVTLGRAPYVGPLDKSPKAPKHIVHGFAETIATSLGRPEDVERIKAEIQRTGGSADWNAFESMFQKQADEKMAARIAERAVLHAEERGFIRPERVDIQKSVLEGFPLYEALKTNPQMIATIDASHAEAIAPIHQDATAQDGAIAATQSTWNHSIEQINEKFARHALTVERLDEIFNRGIKGGSTGETVAGLSMYIAPFGLVEERLANKTAQEVFGLAPNILKNFSDVGGLIAHMRERAANATPEQYGELLSKFEQMVEKDDTFLVVDWTLRNMFQNVMDPNVLVGDEPTYGKFQQAMDTSMTWLDALAGVSKVGKLLGKGAYKAGGNVILQTVSNANKAKGQEKMAEILAEPVPNASKEKWNVSKEDIAISQVPRPVTALDEGGTRIGDLPDGIADEADRIVALREELVAISNKMQKPLYTTQERLAATVREVDLIAKARGGRVRQALSTITQHEGGGGVRFDVMLGRNNLHGWLSERNALLQAKKLQDEGVSGVEIWGSDGTNVHKLYKGGGWEKALDEYNAGTPSAIGNFYVRYKQDYFFNPSDKVMFGNTPVQSYKGFRFLKEILDPRALFDEESVYKKYFLNMAGEQAIAEKLQQVAFPIFKRNRESRRRLGNYYSQIETFGKQNNRMPNREELYEMFPNLTKDDEMGLFQLQNYYDTIHMVQNNRLYREWQSAGYKTLRGVGTQTEYHGLPLALEKVPKNGTAYLDPAIMETIVPSPKFLEELYARGGSIIESALPVAVKDGHYSKLIINDPGVGAFKLEPLNYFPLKKIPGYYPRIYKDNYFIYKIVKDATVDGKPMPVRTLRNIDNNDVVYSGHMQVVSTAPSRKEADDFIAKRMADDPDYDWGILADKRLSDKDKTAADIDMMQVEGRLFYDERNQMPLTSTRGGFADIEDPINLLERTSRMVARQVGSEELVRTLKNSFGQTYGVKSRGGLLPDNYENLPWSQVESHLKSQAKDGSNVSAEALELWRYIRIMEASTNTIAIGWKRGAITLLESLDRMLAKKGLSAGEDATKWALNTAVDWTPDKAMKGAAHLAFIATRPFRQLFIQGMQHVVLSGLDPVYAAGRLQKDAWGLLFGVKARGAALSGDAGTFADLSAHASKTLGLKPDEMRKLITEFDRSGHRGIVDIHSFAGDLPYGGTTTPGTKMGDWVQRTANVFRLPVRAMQRLGFDLGEHYNRAASYMMAVNLHMKKNAYKSINDITEDGWADISLKADDYAFSMHRANMFKYHRGWMSVPFQFLTFTHKTALVTLKAMTKGKIGTGSFTTGEAGRLLAAQAILYGSAGFGAKEAVRSYLFENDLGHYNNTEVEQIITSGFLDWAYDNSLRAIANDPEIDLAWDETMAPGAGIVNQLRRFYQAGVELSPTELIFETSPSGNAISRMWESAKMGYYLFNEPPEVMTPQQKLVNMTDALLSGVIGTYSDAFKVRMTNKYLGLINQTGIPSAYMPKYEELVVKGILGIPTQAGVDQIEYIKDARDYYKELDDDVTKWYKDVIKMTQAYTDGHQTREGYMSKIHQLRVFIEMFDSPLERAYIVDKFIDLDNGQDSRLKSVSQMIAAGMDGGKPPIPYLKERLQSTRLIEDPRELEEILRLVDFATADMTKADAFNNGIRLPNEYQRFNLRKDKDGN